MGLRDAIKGGGGFLNNEDGEITGYEFTNKNVKGEKSEWVYFVPTIKRDGAADEVTQHFFVGGVDQYTISKDGQSLSSEDGVVLGKTTPITRLLESMMDNGLDESELPDLAGGDDLELSALVGRRFRFVQEVDEKATKELGKRKGTGKHKGKEFNRTNTVVSKVYDVDAKAAKGGKSAGKTNGKAAGKSKKDDDGDDLQEEAVAVLTDLLSDIKDGEIPRAKLSMALTKKLMKNENREALRKLITSDDFLALEEGWSVGDDKAETIAAA